MTDHPDTYHALLKGGAVKTASIRRLILTPVPTTGPGPGPSPIPVFPRPCEMFEAHACSPTFMPTVKEAN